jgi:hypothetical protein
MVSVVLYSLGMSQHDVTSTGMSFEEKSTWVYAGVTAAVAAVYVAMVLGAARSTAVDQIAYQGLMLGAVAVAVLASTVCSTVMGTIWPREVRSKDERDRDIERRGNFIGFYVMSVATVVPLGLSMAELAHFWIANALYLAFVVSALVSAAVKVHAYRRGF